MTNHDSMMPDFVVIGAMKCATSSLHDQLDRQTGISMSDPKEPNFFSDGPNFAKGMDWYRALFASMPTGDLKGESSTHLTKYPVHPDSAKRLHESLPDAKLIYVMRDPIKRIVSQYIHEWSQHTISTDINLAIREHTRLIAYSSYAMQIEKYTELYDRAQVLPVFFERLMAEPQAEVERICAFIGYKGNGQWESESGAQNTSQQPQRRSARLNAVLDVPMVKTLRRALMPESLRSRIKSRWTMKGKPEFTNESLEYLCEQLDPDLNTLGMMVGRGLSCSMYNDAVVQGESPEWVDAGAVR
ncbi:MAG: sulfotransferase [Phycisphaerales bacterium]|nr:sulfotransferase [Phycisphaerales bacterium]